MKWIFETGDAIESSPTIDADGTIYIGSNDGKLYAIGGARVISNVSQTNKRASHNKLALFHKNFKLFRLSPPFSKGNSLCHTSYTHLNKMKLPIQLNQVFENYFLFVVGVIHELPLPD